MNIGREAKFEMFGARKKCIEKNFLLYFKSNMRLKTYYYNPDTFTKTFKIYIPEHISLCYIVRLCYLLYYIQ